MEQRIQSLEDQLKAAAGKTPSKAKKIQGRREEITSGNPEEQGHSRRPQENYCPPRSLRRSRREQQRFRARQRKEETQGTQGII